MAQTSAMDSFFLSPSILLSVTSFTGICCQTSFVSFAGDGVNQKITFKPSVKLVTESAAELPSAFYYISQKAVRVIQ